MGAAGSVIDQVRLYAGVRATLGDHLFVGLDPAQPHVYLVRPARRLRPRSAPAEPRSRPAGRSDATAELGGRSYALELPMRCSMRVILVLFRVVSRVVDDALRSRPPQSSPLPGEQHVPPIFVDEPSSAIWLISRSTEGYQFAGRIPINHFTSPGDLVRLDWKQNGKSRGECEVHARWRVSLRRQGDQGQGTDRRRADLFPPTRPIANIWIQDVQARREVVGRDRQFHDVADRAGRSDRRGRG